jgi:hypothetical protein
MPYSMATWKRRRIKGSEHMAADWHRIILANLPALLKAHRAAGGGDRVCLLFDLDQVRANQTMPTIAHLVVDTELHGAVPVNDPENARHFVCLPTDRHRLFAAIDKYERQGADLMRQRLTAIDGLAFWAICYDGDQVDVKDVREVKPEHN